MAKKRNIGRDNSASLRAVNEESRKNALKLSPLGREILENSVQVRIDNKTILLKRKN